MDFNDDFNSDFDIMAGPTATIIRDTGPGKSRNVKIQFSDDNGPIGDPEVRTLSAGTNAQAWADGVALSRSNDRRTAEMEDAIAQCIAGTPPASIVRTRITLPKLWQTLTRRLHNGPRNGMSVEDMRGLAQHVVGRATPSIRSDLNNVRTNVEVNRLKTQWQALLDAQLDDFDEVEEEG